jgi:hypothetical protein
MVQPRILAQFGGSWKIKSMHPELCNISQFIVKGAKGNLGCSYVSGFRNAFPTAV